MSIMLGGMRIPSDPPAQIVPQARRLLYPYFIINGKLKSPMVTTDAPIIPVQAAKRVEKKAGDFKQAFVKGVR